MVAPLIGLAVVIIGAVFVLPRLGSVLPDQKAKQIERAKATDRENKGAFANTWDFFWGNGAAARDFGSKSKGGGNSDKAATAPQAKGTPRGFRHKRRRGRIA